MKKIHMYKEEEHARTRLPYNRMYCGVMIRTIFSDRLNMTRSPMDVTCKSCRVAITKVQKGIK